MSARMTVPGYLACLAKPLAHSEVAAARDYLDALGYHADLQILGVTDWRVAEDLIRSPACDLRAWDIEARERGILHAKARGVLGEAALMAQLTSLAADEGDAIQECAQRAERMDGEPAALPPTTEREPSAMLKAACGAVAMACHERALARLAQAPADHLFMRKYRIFEAGRWPLGVIERTFHLF